jgi:hypothetical protein
MDIGADDLVRRFGRPGDGAGDLGIGDLVGQGRKRLRRVVAGQAFQAIPLDGAAIEPRRRARLQSSERKTKAG